MLLYIKSEKKSKNYFINLDGVLVDVLLFCYLKVLQIYNFSLQHKTLNCLDKNYNIFQTTLFNHTMIFFKLTD